MTPILAVTETQLVVGIVVAAAGVIVGVAGLAVQVALLLQRHLRRIEERFDEAREHREAGFKEARDHTDTRFSEARRSIDELRGDVHQLDKRVVRLTTTVRNFLTKPADWLRDGSEDDDAV